LHRLPIGNDLSAAIQPHGGVYENLRSFSGFNAGPAPSKKTAALLA
jgi:hypothetical protein